MGREVILLIVMSARGCPPELLLEAVDHPSDHAVIDFAIEESRSPFMTFVVRLIVLSDRLHEFEYVE